MNEIEGRGRRSAGFKRKIRAEKAEARKTGKDYIDPPLPERLNPEERLDYERFILPNIKKLPTSEEILKHSDLLEDYVSVRMKIKSFDNSKDRDAEMNAFLERHPDFADGVVEKLRPAIELISSRFKQASNQGK